MKKGVAIIGLATLLLAVYFLFLHKSDEPAVNIPSVELQTNISRNSDAFNVPFENVLNKYFALKDALVNWDTATARNAANDLQQALSLVPYEELNTDTLIDRAKSLSGQITGEAEGLMTEVNIDGQRKSFYSLSEQLYNLVKTVHYDKQVIYHNKCPMAFNNEEDEGWWLSNTNNIVNPYMGNKHPRYKDAMMSCGSVEDSIRNF